MKRFFYTMLLITGFFYLPFPLVFVIAVVWALFVPFVWFEIILLGILFDMVHGSYQPTNWIHLPTMTLAIAAVTLIIIFIRKRMSFHV